MIGILKTIGIWLYKVYFFLPNLAVGFCEAHFKGALGTFITLGALFTVLGLQGLLAGLIIRLVAGRTPITEGEGNSESYKVMKTMKKTVLLLKPIQGFVVEKNTFGLMF